MAPIYQGLRNTFPKNLPPGTIRKEFSLGRQAEHKFQARKYTRLCVCLKRHTEAQARCHCGNQSKYKILLHVSRLDPGWPEQSALPLTLMTAGPSACLSVMVLVVSQTRTNVQGLWPQPRCAQSALPMYTFQQVHPVPYALKASIS